MIISNIEKMSCTFDIKKANKFIKINAKTKKKFKKSARRSQRRNIKWNLFDGDQTNFYGRRRCLTFWDII